MLEPAILAVRAKAHFVPQPDHRRARQTPRCKMTRFSFHYGRLLQTSQSRQSIISVQLSPFRARSRPQYNSFSEMIAVSSLNPMRPRFSASELSQRAGAIMPPFVPQRPNTQSTRYSRRHFFSSKLIKHVGYKRAKSSRE